MNKIKIILGRKTGVALITVILIISILVAASLELNRSSRSDVSAAFNISEGLQLNYIAKSGFYAAAALLVDAKQDYETLRDDWAQTEVVSARSKNYFDHGHFLVKIDDEKGKIPVNKLVNGSVVDENIKEILLRLLKLPEFKLEDSRAEEIVDAMIDWMDDNEEITGKGAESSYYASLNPSYTAKNAQLDCIEELLMIKGITSELFSGTAEKPGLGQYLTIYGTGAISINTAPKMVLRALAPDISVEMADKMDEYRKQSGTDLSSAEWYKKVSGMGEITIKPELIEVAKSNFFLIQATGISGKMEQRINVVMQRAPFQILSWRQD